MGNYKETSSGHSRVATQHRRTHSGWDSIHKIAIPSQRKSRMARGVEHIIPTLAVELLTTVG